MKDKTLAVTFLSQVPGVIAGSPITRPDSLPITIYILYRDNVK